MCQCSRLALNDLEPNCSVSCELLLLILQYLQTDHITLKRGVECTSHEAFAGASFGK